MAKQTLFITSPLEAEHVARIRTVDPARLEIIYDADLYPPLRYVADHKGAPSFTRTAEQTARWRQHLASADILLDYPPLAADGPGDIVYAKRAKWIQMTSSGVGQTVKKLGLCENDVIVTTARGVHGQPLAEFTFMALLAHFRRHDFLKAEQRAHRWERYCDEEVAGRTLVTIGAGDLARAVAQVARGLEMKVIAITRSPEKPRPHAALFDEILGVSALHQALARADTVVMTVPHTDETENMLDRAAIAAMKHGCAFVNTGRGQCVDEDAMIDALRTGKIGYAAIDVAVIEPLPDQNPLWDMPNVLICPHSASTVTTENRKITEIFCENIRLYLDGRAREMRNILDKTLLY